MYSLITILFEPSCAPAQLPCRFLCKSNYYEKAFVNFFSLARPSEIYFLGLLKFFPWRRGFEFFFLSIFSTPPQIINGHPLFSHDAHQVCSLLHQVPFVFISFQSVYDPRYPTFHSICVQFLDVQDFTNRTNSSAHGKGSFYYVLLLTIIMYYNILS